MLPWKFLKKDMRLKLGSVKPYNNQIKSPNIGLVKEFNDQIICIYMTTLHII